MRVSHRLAAAMLFLTGIASTPLFASHSAVEVPGEGLQAVETFAGIADHGVFLGCVSSVTQCRDLAKQSGYARYHVEADHERCHDKPYACSGMTE